MKECERFTEGTRQRSICEGTANLPLSKINAYRKQWGLFDLTEDQVPEYVAESKSSPARPIPRRSTKSGGCKGCGSQRKTAKKIVVKKNPPTIELGDVVANTLKTFGITPDKVSRWLGRPCGCKSRQDKLNKLSMWAKRMLTGNKEEAISQLDEMIDG